MCPPHTQQAATPDAACGARQRPEPTHRMHPEPSLEHCASRSSVGTAGRPDEPARHAPIPHWPRAHYG
eukprot:6101752-Prymnesium_polylepis.1